MNDMINIKEMSLDSSLFSDLDKSLTKEEYIDRVVSLLQPILDKNFINCHPKTQIRIKHDRINFACPFCMDSMKDIYKKRGNIILEGKHKNKFKCHNCSEYKSVDRFFNDFKVNLDLDFINYISSTNNNNYVNNKYDASLLFDMNQIEEYAIDREQLKKYFKLIEVKGSQVWPWLVKRQQWDETKFLYNPNKNYIAILNLTPNGKIIGLQKRLLIKTRNKYNTYKLSKLYEAMNNVRQIPEWLDVISQIYNICLTNFSRPITLTEGPFDSFLIKNACANTGANKQFPMDVSIQYFFDSDSTGQKRSLEEINKGNSVFLWNKLKNDLQLPNREKWDTNDVVIWCKENNIKIPNWSQYFSNDELDAIDI